MLLQRSGEHPLDVILPQRYSGSAPKSYRYSHVLDTSANASRIRKFTVYQDEDRNHMNHLVRAFSKPAPNLTHLELTAFIPPGEFIPFPNLFGLEFPKLRVLEVLRVGAWPEVVGANLTRITIADYFDPQLFKRCIPYSPNLQALKIRDVWDSREPDLRTWQRIALPPGIRLVIKHSRVCARILELFSLPRDGHIKIRPSMNAAPGMPLFSYILPTEVSHLQNLHTLTRLHMKKRPDAGFTLELKFFRLDRLALEVNVGHPFRTRETVQQHVMSFLAGLHQAVLGGVEELRMEGLAGSLEPHAADLQALLKRMPVLTRLITTDDNEEILRSALDNLGCRAVVVRVD